MQPGKGVPEGVFDGDSDADADAVREPDELAVTEAVKETDAEVDELSDTEVLSEADALTLELSVAEPLFVTDREPLTELETLAVTVVDSVTLALADRVGELSTHPCGPEQYWQPSPTPLGIVKTSM